MEFSNDIGGNFGKRGRVEGVGKMPNTCVNVNKGNSVPTSEFPYTYSYLLFIQFEKKLVLLAYQRRFWKGGGANHDAI